VSLNEPSALHISTRVCFVRVESLRTRHGTTVSAPVCDGDSWSYEHRGRTYTCTGLAQVTSLPWPAPPHTTQQPSVLPPLGFGRDPASPSHASEQRSRTTKSRDGYQRGPLGQYLQAVAAWWHALGMSHHHQSKRALPRVHCKAQRPPAHNAVATTGGDERVPLAARSTSQCSHRDGSWKKAGAAAHAWLACYARCDTPRRCHTRARPRTRPPARHRTRSLLLGGLVVRAEQFVTRHRAAGCSQWRRAHLATTWRPPRGERRRRPATGRRSGARPSSTRRRSRRSASVTKSS
jgi:hypothetical protein